MKKIQPRKQIKNLKPELDKLVKKLVENSDLSDVNFVDNPEHLKRITLKTFDFYICDSVRGWTKYGKNYCTIPLWAKNKSKEYFIYYVAHTFL